MLHWLRPDLLHDRSASLYLMLFFPAVTFVLLAAADHILLTVDHFVLKTSDVRCNEEGDEIMQAEQDNHDHPFFSQYNNNNHPDSFFLQGKESHGVGVK